MVEICYGKGLAAYDESEAGDLLVREGEEGVEDAQLVHDVKGGGMDGIAAEVSEEILMFFKDGDGDALTGKKEAKHDACGAAADDAAGGWGGLDRVGGHRWDEGSKHREERQRVSMTRKAYPRG